MTKKYKKEWGCPLTKSRTNWCFGLCIPQDGVGRCGRIAPHSLAGRTQRAIMNFQEKNMKQKYSTGIIVRALCNITEGGGEHNKTPDYEVTDFRGNPNYVHAKEGELGEIMTVDDGCPTVRFLRTKTATIVGDHEIEILQ